MAEAILTGTGLYTPPFSISNDELVASFNAWVTAENARNQQAIESGDMQPLQESNSAFIEKASGIRSRYVMNKEGILDPERMVPRLPERSNEEASVQSEMAVAAARQALEAANLEASELDAVIVACSNMQRAYPAVAVEVQQLLGAGGFAFDMNVACSSATFGLQMACDMIKSGSARRVLMVNPEICTGHLNFRDRDSHFIFGDACTAAIVESVDVAKVTGWKVLGTKLWTQFSNNIRNNAGFLNRTAEEGIGQPDKLFVQNGRKVFKEVCPQVAKHISEHLSACDIPVDDLSRMWLHQANLSMNQLVARKVLGREPDITEAPVILDEYANTSSAGSVIAFHKYSQDLPSGSKGVLCSFGAGYSVGSVILEKR
ncbi:beta-ketoacyl-ACP synthase III [Parendozoicomonas haliclonae]|uniref:3-oxoacyl-[acyl-carrier-protein] synthase 3 n=1 Tax=Parendozoicomonas haliclonae TaxID=1960125 RepID=A0A1X7AH71_9GAMM|nr:beta-ketoacyl-ACP synthase III [Parendozoicomonas haliclonae]SMA41978.1 3-oxoacyl-[acyl-carrier-protein] synthase 3 [Parendozoicomonas haliclonae]